MRSNSFFISWFILQGMNPCEKCTIKPVLMKKIMMIMLTVLMLVVIVTGSQKEEVAIAIEEVIPVSDFDLKINAEIDQAVFDVFVKLNENYREKESKVVFTYEKKADSFFLSYLFDFSVIKQNQPIRKVKRTFNYNATDGRPLVISETLLKDKYLPLLINEYAGRGIAVNESDLKFFKYVIAENGITFYYPRDYDANYLEVALPNLGVSLATPEAEEGEKFAALTFDDGPGPTTKELVDLLDRHGIKATFFLVGERVRFYPEAAAYIHRHGHELGNHSYSHPDFKQLTMEEAAREITAAQAEIHRATNAWPKSFRFPYGNFHRQMLAGIDVPVVLWNCDSEDWRYRDGQIVFQNVVKNLGEQAVILFHDTGRHKPVIEAVIEYLSVSGYRFVTVTEMFRFYEEENVVFGKIYY
jgi:peptidoglycan/xylan/chitin deacetylase (PgdA/CDA1 family)